MCGSFTNWIYKPMISLDMYCRIIDRTKNHDFINKMRILGRCRYDVGDEAELNPSELERYNKMIAIHNSNRRKNWRKSFINSLRYNKKPFIVNG